MDWILFFAIATHSGSDRVIDTTTVPIATKELCEAAKAQLLQVHKQMQSPNFLVVGECLRVR